MPNYNQSVVNTFVRGLITEAGELTFPENASVDENNCELFRDGSRRRRKAMEFEDNFSYSSFSVAESDVVKFGEWRNAGNIADNNYLIVQVGSMLYFYDKNIVPYSTSEKSFSLDLTDFEFGDAGRSATVKCDFTSILGNLVVVNKFAEPFYITLNDSEEIAAVQISCRVRDFKWLGDKTTYNEGQSDPSELRRYDTLNCGWVGEKGGAALSTYIGSEGEWPPLTHPWYSGKNSDGDFNVGEWKKVYSGNSLIGNGHFILDLFNKQRQSESGVSGLDISIETVFQGLFTLFSGGSIQRSTFSGVRSVDIETEQEPSRFTTAETLASRVFFSGLSSAENAGKVYFSKLLQDMTDIGDFFQNNDPTAEDFSDLLETDGGVIVIPDASNIRKLYAFQGSLFVFADNGVWQIKGVDGASFSPTSYSVAKITTMGLVTRESFTQAEGVPFWWSKHGIHTLSFDQYGNASEQNLSVATIQTFWNNINNDSKRSVVAEYDKVNKRIYWFYPCQNTSADSNRLNRALVLDVPLQAFYPWSIACTSETSSIVGLQFYDGFGSSDTTFDVIVGFDDIVVGLDNIVVTQPTPLSDSTTNIVYFVRDPSVNKMTMATMTSNTYLDWGTEDYTSYAETGYDFADDLILKKTAPYIVTYMRETEAGLEVTSGGGYTPTNDSSLLVSAYWDFKKAPAASGQQAYRRKSNLVVNASDLTFTSEESVITTRMKVRGRGRSLKIRMESETGKDFIYLGHGLITDTAGRF